MYVHVYVETYTYYIIQEAYAYMHIYNSHAFGHVRIHILFKMTSCTC